MGDEKPIGIDEPAMVVMKRILSSAIYAVPDGHIADTKKPSAGLIMVLTGIEENNRVTELYIPLSLRDATAFALQLTCVIHELDGELEETAWKRN